MSNNNDKSDHLNSIFSSGGRGSSMTNTNNNTGGNMHKANGK